MIIKFFLAKCHMFFLNDLQVLNLLSTIVNDASSSRLTEKLIIHFFHIKTLDLQVMMAARLGKVIVRLLMTLQYPAFCEVSGF